MFIACLRFPDTTHSQLNDHGRDGLSRTLLKLQAPSPEEASLGKGLGGAEAWAKIRKKSLGEARKPERLGKTEDQEMLGRNTSGEAGEKPPERLGEAWEVGRGLGKARKNLGRLGSGLGDARGWRQAGETPHKPTSNLPKFTSAMMRYCGPGFRQYHPQEKTLTSTLSSETSQHEQYRT